MVKHTDKLTAQEHRVRAAASEESAAASFERSDTDGFLSQWASGITAQEHRLAADLLEEGGKSNFAGLFDAQGRRIKAKLVQIEDRYKGYGTRSLWLVLDANDKALAWIPRQYSRRVNRKTGDLEDVQPSPRSKMAKLGLHEAYEMAPAMAKIVGSGKGLSGAASARVAAVRTDQGYPEGAIVASIREQA
jgi:hypothetical protein